MARKPVKAKKASVKKPATKPKRPAVKKPRPVITHAQLKQAQTQAQIRLERIKLRVEKGESTWEKEREECERVAKEKADGEAYESVVSRQTTIAIDRHLGRKNVKYPTIKLSRWPKPKPRGDKKNP